MKAVKKYSSGGKVKSGCGCGKKGCNCKAKSYADGGLIDAIRKLLGKDKVRKGHRAVKKAARQENRAERQSEKDKKKRTYKYANPRFL